MNNLRGNPINRRRRWRLWTPVAVYCAAIFIQSSFTMDGALPPINYVDLVAHGAAYGLLGLLVARAITGSHPIRTRWVIWLIATGLTAVYGVSDEVHQAIVPGRHCDGWDMMADAVGGGLGAGIWIWFSSAAFVENRPLPR